MKNPGFNKNEPGILIIEKPLPWDPRETGCDRMHNFTGTFLFNTVKTFLFDHFIIAEEIWFFVPGFFLQQFWIFFIVSVEFFTLDFIERIKIIL